MFEKWGFRFGKVVPKVKLKDQIKTWRILTGDIVQVIDGPLSGQKGKVIEVRRHENRVIIEGLNIIRKRFQGEYYNIEQGIQASKIALLDPLKELPTKIRWGWVDDGRGGYKRTRMSKLTGTEIPKPAPPVRTRTLGPYDTAPEEAHRVTFVPSLRKPPLPSDCRL